MALLNANINDIVATTIELRSKDIADNVTAQNAVFTQMQKKGAASNLKCNTTACKVVA